MSTFIKYLTVFILCMSSALAFHSRAAQKDWETLKIENKNAKPISSDDKIEIKSLPSLIIVNVGQTSKVEIFTILGRLVSNETLQPGSYQFEVPVHGIYIVKVGDLTCKIAV